MILFTIIVCAILAVPIIGLFAALAAGGAYIIAYADVIVCIALVALIVYFIVRRKKKRK